MMDVARFKLVTKNPDGDAYGKNKKNSFLSNFRFILLQTFRFFSSTLFDFQMFLSDPGIPGVRSMGPSL